MYQTKAKLNFPYYFASFHHWKTLHIEYQFEENARIQKLPGILDCLTHLERLTLSNCDLKEFQQDLCKLTSLAVLDIAGNGKIQNLPCNLEDLTKVKTLALSGCGLTELPQVLCKLKSLQNLNISRNPL